MTLKISTGRITVVGVKKLKRLVSKEILFRYLIDINAVDSAGFRFQSFPSKLFYLESEKLYLITQFTPPTPEDLNFLYVHFISDVRKPMNMTRVSIR